MALLNMDFTSVRALRNWLDMNRSQCDSPEEYDEWLQQFFEDGNTVTVHGEEFDYWACWELV